MLLLVSAGFVTPLCNEPLLVCAVSPVIMDVIMDVIRWISMVGSRNQSG